MKYLRYSYFQFGREIIWLNSSKWKCVKKTIVIENLKHVVVLYARNRTTFPIVLQVIIGWHVTLYVILPLSDNTTNWTGRAGCSVIKTWITCSCHRYCCPWPYLIKHCDRDHDCHFTDYSFKCILCEWKCMKCVPNGPINNISALVQIMVWQTII